MEFYKVEKGVEVPRKHQKSKWVELAEGMSKGDSVLVYDKSEGGSLRYALLQQGKPVTMRSVKVDGQSCYRVWHKE
jgi:hypothetical protein